MGLLISPCLCKITAFISVFGGKFIHNQNKIRALNGRNIFKLGINKLGAEVHIGSENVFVESKQKVGVMSIPGSRQSCEAFISIPPFALSLTGMNSWYHSLFCTLRISAAWLK